MGFTVGKMQDSPLLTAYSTTKQLKQKDTELEQNQQEIDIDKAYKEGLITNQEKQILIQKNRLDHDINKYDTTGKDLDIANTNNLNTNASLNQYQIDSLKKEKALGLLKSDATSQLNTMFSQGMSDVSAQDLITVDKNGNFQFNDKFVSENYGSSKNANTMRKELIEELIKVNPNLTESEINQVVSDNWDDIYGENLSAQYYDMNQYLSQAWQDEMKNADTDGDGKVSAEEQKAINEKLSQFIGTNPNMRNIMAPGLIAQGMDPSNLMYNISGHNVPITSDISSYKDVMANAQGFTYELDTDTMQWKKVPIASTTTSSGNNAPGMNPNAKNPNASKHSKKAQTSTDPSLQVHDYDNFETATSNNAAFELHSNLNNSSLSGNVSFEDQSKGVRKEYYEQIVNEYKKWWASDGWGPAANLAITTTGSKDQITFGWGMNFFDHINRDYTYTIKHKDGRPYVTTEGEWGDNDQYTVWLDDTWNDLGYSSISEYIATALYNKSGDWEHMGD